MESAAATESNENKETSQPTGRRFSCVMAKHGEDLSHSGQNWQKAGESIPNQPLADNMGRRFSYKMNDHQDYRSDDGGWVNIEEILPQKAKVPLKHIRDIEESEAIGTEHQGWKKDKVIDKKFDELPTENPWLSVESVVIKQNVKDSKEKEKLLAEEKNYTDIPHKYDETQTQQAMVSSDKQTLQKVPKDNELKEANNFYKEAEDETIAQDEKFWEKHKDIPKKFDELPKKQPWVSIKEVTVQNSREKETGNQRETEIQGEDKEYLVGNTTKLLSSWSIDRDMHSTSNKDRFGRRSSLPVTPSKPFGIAYAQPSSNDRRGSLMPTGRHASTIQSHHMQNKFHAQSSARSPDRYHTDIRVSTIPTHVHRKGKQDEGHQYQRGLRLDKRHHYNTTQEMKDQRPQFYSRIPDHMNQRSPNFRPRDPSPDYD